MMRQPIIRISEIVGEPHLKQFNSTKLHQVDKGGRSSAKSSKNEVKIALQMLKDKTCEVAVIRQNYTDHRDTTFAGLKIGFQRLHYPLKSRRDYPMGKHSAMFMSLPQGNYVHFAGANDLDSIKGIRPTRLENQIKILWLFEITQFKSEYEMQQIIATFLRGKKDYFMILYEYNPHPKPSHWTYEWARKMQKREDAYVQHTNYNDLPEWQQKEWVGELMIQEIETLKEIDYEQYKNIYLGLPANLIGSIYKRFDRDVHVKPCGNEPYMKMDIGVDYGVTDATVFTARGTLAGFRGIQIPTSYYHKNGKSQGNYLQEDYLDRLFEFCERVYNKFGVAMTVWVDSAEADFKRTFEREVVFRGIGYIMIGNLNKLMKLDKPKLHRGEVRQKDTTAIQSRISILNRMFGAKYIEIDPVNVELIAAIEEAEYNKDHEPLDDGSVNRDSIDSLDYSFLDDMEVIDDIILTKRGVDNVGKREQETRYIIGH